jgi:polar amino acid transport system substrate-binding protein
MKLLKMYFALFSCLLLVTGCNNFPKDPENTLAQVKNGTLLVGYSENHPWVIKTDSVPTGIEPDLVKAFAKTLNAQIKWQNGTEQHLFEGLEKKRLHLVIAGVTDTNPWKNKLGFTRPYYQAGKKKQVMVIMAGENAFLVELEKFLEQQKPALRSKISK